MEMVLAMNPGTFEESSSNMIQGPWSSLTMDELLYVDGGAWSWKAFGQSVIIGATCGAGGGFWAGNVVVPVLGSVPGWAAGGIGGALGGAIGYLICGWW